MPALYTTLQIKAIFQGVTVTTLDLVDNQNYQLQEDGYAPGVPKRSTSPLGQMYEYVIDEITLNVYGATGAIALQNLHVLSQALDQSQAWRNDDSEDSVLLLCQPQGSDLTDPLEAIMVGTQNNASLLDLPVAFNDALMVYEIEGVVIRFLRGVWLGDDEVETTTAVQAPAEHNFTFSLYHPVPSPVELEIDGFSMPSIGGIYPEMYLFTGRNFKTVYLNNRPTTATTAPTGGTFNSITMSTALNSDVWRLQPSAAGEYTVTDTSTGINAGLEHTGLYAVFACMRNNADSVDFTVKGQMWSANLFNEQQYMAESEPKVITVDNRFRPLIYYIGTIAYDIDATIGALRLSITPNSVNAASGQTLDVDYFLFVAVQPTTNIIYFPLVNDYGTKLRINPDLNDRKIPEVVHINGALTKPVGHKGNAYLYTDTDQFSAFICGATEDHFSIRGGASMNNLSFSMTATRRLAYLVPQ